MKDKEVLYMVILDAFFTCLFYDSHAKIRAKSQTLSWVLGEMFFGSFSITFVPFAMTSALLARFLQQFHNKFLMH